MGDDDKGQDAGNSDTQMQAPVEKPPHIGTQQVTKGNDTKFEKRA